MKDDEGGGCAPTPPTATEEDRCGRCGKKPVAFAEWRTGGIFTPPPSGVWMFLCAACAGRVEPPSEDLKETFRNLMVYGQPCRPGEEN